ncbi:MAG: Spy/CpxP family protein refolding chaperone [Candidatus Aminicenantia bacterium]
MRKSALFLISMLVAGGLFLFSGMERGYAYPFRHGDDSEFMGPEGPLAPAGQLWGFERFGRWWKNSRFVQELNLKDEQIEKIEKIFFETQKKLVDLRASCKKAELDLEGLEGKEAEALKKIDEIYKLKSEIHKNLYLMTNQIKKVLTPEQIKKMEELRAQIAKERMQRFREKRTPARKGL